MATTNSTSPTMESTCAGLPLQEKVALALQIAFDLRKENSHVFALASTLTEQIEPEPGEASIGHSLAVILEDRLCKTSLLNNLVSCLNTIEADLAGSHLKQA